MAIFERKLTEEEAKNLDKRDDENPEDELLSDVAGGYVHDNLQRQCFEVIDDRSGKVLDRGYRSLIRCRERAAELGQSTDKISDEYLARLRGQ